MENWCNGAQYASTFISWQFLHAFCLKLIIIDKYKNTSMTMTPTTHQKKRSSLDSYILLTFFFYGTSTKRVYIIECIAWIHNPHSYTFFFIVQRKFGCCFYDFVQCSPYVIHFHWMCRSLDGESVRLHYNHRLYFMVRQFTIAFFTDTTLRTHGVFARFVVEWARESVK